MLALKKLKPYFNYSIYLDVPADISFIRRLMRDCNERGRSVNSVINQYLLHVRPMQEKFVIPYAVDANICISDPKNVEHIAKKICFDLHID